MQYQPSNWQLIAILSLGVGVLSFAAILIRLLQFENLTSLQITQGRLLLAFLILVPIAIKFGYGIKKKIAFRNIRLCFIAGIILACHFVFWIESLLYISIAESTALVTTSPIWVVIFSFFFIKKLRI